MAEIIHLRKNPHEEVQELLPWLVNGTLASDEVEQVEAHLVGCAECRAELAAERQLAAAIESSPADTEGAWERMEERLDATKSPSIRWAPNIWSKRVPMGWAVAGPVAAAAAVALFMVNVSPSRAPEPQYRALGAAQSAAAANLIVQFQPQSHVGDMQAALRDVNARLVDGPTDAGAYLLQVDGGKRELVLKQLRDNQTIALAEPIDGPPRE
jgi:anti-sigma-K factor RskA